MRTVFAVVLFEACDLLAGVLVSLAVRLLLKSIPWNDTSGLVNVSDLHVLIVSISQICSVGPFMRFPVYFIPVALFECL